MSDNVLREIQRETRERLTVLDIDRLNVDEKSAAEASAVGDASRVEFSEREWRKRRPESLDEIKRIVDAMGTPREERLKVGERVFLPPDEPLPPTRALTELERKAIEAHLGAKVLRASIIYRSSRGHVVEVEHDRDGRKEVTLLSVLGERVRDLGDIRSRIDAFDPKGAVEEVVAPAAPEPPAPVAPVAPEAALAPEPAPEPSEAAPQPPPAEAAPKPAKKRFAMPKLGRKKETPEEDAPAPAEALAEEAPKKRFGLPTRAKKAEAAPEAPPAEDPAGEKKGFTLPFGKKKDAAVVEPPREETPKKRFGLSLGRKKEEAPADGEAPAAEGGGISRFLKRKKDA